MVRSRRGIHIDVTDIHGKQAPDEPVYALFFLISPEQEPKQHLRFLAELAERTDEDTFMCEWLADEKALTLKETLLHNDRYLVLNLLAGTRSQVFINKPLHSVSMPNNTLVALVRRGHQMIIPHGDTIFRENDHLIVIGEPHGINLVNQQYAESSQPVVANGKNGRGAKRQKLKG